MTATSLTVQRVRHPIKARMLKVLRVTRPTPHLVRVTFVGDDLADFVSASFDDHVKLFLPSSPGATPVLPIIGDQGIKFPEGAARPLTRDYTPRRYDPHTGELDIEFVLHGSGPAASWAAQAAPGDLLGIAGPRGSFVVPLEFDWHVLVGDESAMPAIARRLAELPRGKQAIVIIETLQADARLAFDTEADADVRGVLREGDASALPAAMGALVLPSGDGFVWVAAEYAAVRAVRERLVQQHGLDKSRIRASSYWRGGISASHETFND